MDRLSSNTSSRQLLDYYLLNEYVLQDARAGYAAKVKGTLAASHAIRVKERDVYQRVQRILAGDSIRPSGDVCGTPALREGKDQNYAGLLSIMDIFHPRTESRSYIGLPANQLDVVADRIKGRIVAVERDPARAQQLEKLKNFVVKRRPHVRVEVVNDDIWSVLQKRSREFNVFDLDLMCPMPEDSFEWAESVYNAAQPGFSVLHLATTVGRVLSDEDYEKRIVWFNRNLHSVGFKPAGCSRFSYRDRRTPMRCERYVLFK